MKTKLMFMAIAILSAVVCMTSCGDDNGENTANSPSYRDGEYPSSNIAVYVNDVPYADVSASISSKQRSGEGSSTEDGSGDVTINSNITYDMTIKLTNFPNREFIITLTTVLMNQREFSGETKLDGIAYKYSGEFTSDLLAPIEEQKCVIKFVTIK